MKKNKWMYGIVISLFSGAVFSSTLVLQSTTGDKELDGTHEVAKIDGKHWANTDRTITGYKIKFIKTPGMVKGVRKFEAIENIKLASHDPVHVYFTGTVGRDHIERGSYIKLNPKTDAVIGYGFYTFKK